MGKKINKYLYWIPRILSILFILFLTMLSLDVFSPDLGFWEIVLGLFMHNIPTFILIAVLIISWKYEIVGGIVFILAGLFYIIMLLMNQQLEWNMFFGSLIISGPAFLIGILFLIGWVKKRRV